jgi:hypothetical protein
MRQRIEMYDNGEQENLLHDHFPQIEWQSTEVINEEDTPEMSLKDKSKINF